jgi:hypothetical protein
VVIKPEDCKQSSGFFYLAVQKNAFVQPALVNIFLIVDAARHGMDAVPHPP